MYTVYDVVRSEEFGMDVQQDSSYPAILSRLQILEIQMLELCSPASLQRVTPLLSYSGIHALLICLRFQPEVVLEIHFLLLVRMEPSTNLLKTFRTVVKQQEGQLIHSIRHLHKSHTDTSIPNFRRLFSF